MQAFFDCSFAEAPSEKLMPAFSLLRKINQNILEETQKINFTELISRLVFCFDLIYAENDKRLLFTADCENITVCEKPQKISFSFLNILFKLIESCNTYYFFVTVEEIVGKALINIEFDADGGFSSAPFFYCDGSDYIKSIGGCLLLIHEGSFIRAVIEIPVIRHGKFKPYRTPEIEDLLFDRLSVVYSSFF